jgi:hypothetical protein
MLRFGNSPASLEMNFVLVVTTLSSSQGNFWSRFHWVRISRTHRSYYSMTGWLAVGLRDRYRTGRHIYIRT